MPRKTKHKREHDRLQKKKEYAAIKAGPEKYKEDQCSDRPQSPKVKKLSDIKVTDWENRKFYLDKKEPIDKTFKTDFGKFVNSEPEHDTKENVEGVYAKREIQNFCDDDSDENIF
ncbi:hypothetical protein B5X24_HaOG211993 [Helicoverpa armigera]|nr:hypothetical protein B5X24_HaOG211993 [Helicoverpa armigera]